MDDNILINWFRVPNWVSYISPRKDGSWHYHENPAIYNEYTQEFESEGKHIYVQNPPLLAKKRILFTREGIQNGTN